MTRFPNSVWHKVKGGWILKAPTLEEQKARQDWIKEQEEKRYARR